MRVLPSYIKNLSLTEHVMPALFIGHGSPMNAIENNPFTQALKKLSREIPKPKAILCVSAHWLTRGTHILKSEKPKTIHDFYGFPEKLYQIEYPASGAPEAAKETQQLISSAKTHLTEEWGLDHGCWTVLLHMYPQADIPVYELSIDYYKPFEYHLKIAEELKALRKKGVLIIGSGNITHNLGKVNFTDINAAPADWAIEFDQKVQEAFETRSKSFLIHPEKTGALFKTAHPEPSHYIPLIYTFGVADLNEQVTYPYDQFQYGTLSMRAIKIS
ncbi:MAG: 4,5-DOPA dioxygenase extradiol [Bacteroidetes bacterium]|nr:MAG: 4,5-DOPA dioxygenase extradiol [Bacteroidota bacterium]